MIIEMIIGTIINLYVSLGLGTKEYKINAKVDKIAKEHPEILEYYDKYQWHFEQDEELSQTILQLNLKDSKEVERIIALINQKKMEWTLNI